MATLDDSPSLFTGQAWDVWDEAVNSGESKEDESLEVAEDSQVTDSMKLQRQDMNLFGFCPSRDEFFLVVCDNCGQVVKPQALQAHIEMRHKYSIPKFSPIATTAASHKSPPASSSTPTRSSTPSSKSSSSGKGPPSEENVSKSRTLDAKAIARSRTSPAKSRKNLRDLKLKKNHSLPVVKVERIPSPLDGTVSITSDKIKTLSPIAQPVSPAGSPLIQAMSPEPSPVTHVKAEPSPVADVSPTHSPVMRDSVEDTVVTEDGLTVTRISEEAKERVNQLVPPHSPLEVTSDPSPPPPRLPPSPIQSPVSVPMTSIMSPLNVTSSDVSDASMTSPVMSRPDPRTVPVLKKNRYVNIPKQEKLLPCKDREYDPDKHCGVWIPDIQKHCTRSLTCKTHALSLRRGVLGRSTDFDTLLDDHRTAKEEILRAKAEANGMPFVPSKAATKSAMRKAENERRVPKLNGVTLGQSLDKSLSVSLHSPLSVSTSFGANVSSTLSPPRLLQKATKLAANNKLHKPLFSPTMYSLPGKESTPPPEVSSRLSSDGEEDSGPYPAAGVSFIKFHPRPAASCKFNARLSGSSVVFNRKHDLLRAAFSQAVEKHLHPPPHKKLCVESKLPREPSAAAVSKDPYEFIFVNSPHTKVPTIVSTATGSVFVTTPTSSAHVAAAPIHTTSLLTHNHVATLLPSKFVVQKTAVHKKPSVNRTIKPKDSVTAKPITTTARRPSGSSPQANVAIAPNTQPISISIPNTLTMNLGNMGSLNTASMGERKNNVLVEPSLANGQFLSISSMAELQNNIHLQNVERKRQHQQQQHHKLQKTTNSILTCLPSGTFVVENKAQLGGSVLIGGGAAGRATSSPQHVRPSPTASPLVHTGTISPQVLTASPLSNGIIPSPSSLKNLSYTITTGAPHGTPSPASVGSPSPSYTGSAGEDMSPLQHYGMVQSIVNHNLIGKSRPHKPNSRPPGGPVSQLVQPTNNNTSQPPRIISALPSNLYSGQLVARSKVALPHQNAVQKRPKHHVTLPFVTSPGPMVQPDGEPPLKRPRAEIRVHHQNSPSNYISQQH